MTALTSNYDAERKDGILVAYKVAADAVIFKGALVCLDADGYLVPAADAPGLKFAGVAYEKGDNTDGDAGDVTVRIWKDGSFKVAKFDAEQSDIGKYAYCVDDNTVIPESEKTACAVLAGKIVEISGKASVRIQIRQAAN